MSVQHDFEVVVIGSGFGGSVLTCRTAKKWPGKVLLLERGKRYPLGSFPRTPHGQSGNFWSLPSEDRARPALVPSKETHGMFDIRNYKRIDAVVCAGLGGGSLIYANVFLEPPPQVFDKGWPSGWSKSRLESYYAIAKAVLGSRPIPQNGDPRREIIRTKLFAAIARGQQRESRLADINVFFGNDFNDPLEIGIQSKNRYGALQTSCTYCGECDVGCNTQSKNTLDLNYIFVAENRYRAKVLTEHLATKIVPVDSNGNDDATAFGRDGFRVYYTDLIARKDVSVLARRVVVSAGTLGSTEFLLRCRDIHRSLPQISQRLGQGFSANGDFLSFVVTGRKPADPNYGPVITQYTDFNLFANFDRNRAFVLEDAAYPTFASWYLEGALPVLSFWARTKNIVKHLLTRFSGGASLGRLGFLLSDLLQDDLSYRTCVLLCMGLDNSNGTMRLNRNGYLEIDWPRSENMPLYKAIIQAGKKFAAAIEGKAWIALPNWWWPIRKNITVHALGGCNLGDGPRNGVTSAVAGSLGQVFGYNGLYVADGAIVPVAVGVNPTATILALSEMVARDITGDEPDADL